MDRLIYAEDVKIISDQKVKLLNRWKSEKISERKLVI